MDLSLWFGVQPRPLLDASYTVSVRRNKLLPFDLFHCMGHPKPACHLLDVIRFGFLPINLRWKHCPLTVQHLKDFHLDSDSIPFAFTLLFRKKTSIFLDNSSKNMPWFSQLFTYICSSVSAKWTTSIPDTHTGLAKVAVQCSADTFVVNQSLFLRINICGENRHLRQARNRYRAF